ncbi:MAG: CmcI family methyltransferase [Myxococcales bacterium]
MDTAKLDQALTFAKKLKNLAKRRAHSVLLRSSLVPNEFHQLYYGLAGEGGRAWERTSWMGTKILKCPFDLWIYQELIHAHRPDLIIETGTCYGGSALYMAHICDLVGHGEIVTIDIKARGTPAHPRIQYLSGSSVAPEILERVRDLVKTRPRTLVVLDSDHRREHVLAELRAYQEFVPNGGYMVVEDTNVNGHPVYPEFGPGPMEALEQFLGESQDFRSDPECEKFHLTFNPKGFLRRQSGGANVGYGAPASATR